MSKPILGAAFLVTMLIAPGIAMADPSPTPAAPTAATAAPAPAATVAPEITARAKEWRHRFQTGDVDRSQLDTTMNSALTPEMIQQVSEQLAPLGDPITFTIAGQQATAGGVMVYVYHVTFKTAGINEAFVLDKDGKIAGIRFAPAQ
jgi:hypothetical protein